MLTDLEHKMKPKITIITVCYNAGAKLDVTISSVINQDYNNIEYIIIDGGSSDETVNIIKKYEDRITKWISEEDDGIYYAMNKGIKLASGEWINFMNAGDSFTSSQTLSIVEKNLNNNIDILYGSANLMYKEGIRILKPEKLVNFNKKLPFCHQASFVRTEIIKKRPYNTKYKMSADYDFMYYCFRKSYKFAVIDKIIANYEIEDGASIRNRIIGKREDANINGSIKSIYWPAKFLMWKMYFFYIRIFLKKILPQNIINKIHGVS